MINNKSNVFRQKGVQIFILQICFLWGTSILGQNNKANEKVNKIVRQKQRTQENIKIIYEPIKDSSGSIVPGYMLVFGIGFKTKTDFTVFLNKKLIKKVYCQTNYSIGFCTNDYHNIDYLYIPYESIKDGDCLSIETKGKWVILKIPQLSKRYNRIVISNDNGWSATFQKRTESVSLE